MIRDSPVLGVGGVDRTEMTCGMAVAITLNSKYSTKSRGAVLSTMGHKNNIQYLGRFLEMSSTLKAGLGSHFINRTFQGHGGRRLLSWHEAAVPK